MDINSKLKGIVDTLSKEGIAKSHVKDIFTDKELDYFNSFIDYYNDEYLANPEVINRINGISQGNPVQNTSHKWYEITQYEHLGRGLTFNDGDFLNLYLSDTLVDMATYFFGETPKLRNLFTYIHPQNPSQNEFASQAWHRDPENFKIFKVFIYLNDITKENGAMQYIKYSQFGGKHQGICDNIIGNNYGRGWRFHYTPPSEDIVLAEGETGTIYFVNTHGLHKGGLVNKGIRCLTHGCYLNPDAYEIVSGTKSLANINDRPKIMDIDYNSTEFNTLTPKQQFILS